MRDHADGDIGDDYRQEHRPEPPRKGAIGETHEGSMGAVAAPPPRGLST